MYYENSDFAEDCTRVLHWNSFVKKKRAMIQIEFREVIGATKYLCEPIIVISKDDETYEGMWESAQSSWSKD